MPEQSHPPYEAGAITVPRRLQRWLDVNPQNGPLTRARKYITIPLFSINVIWLGYSQIVGEYHFEAPNNFSFQSFDAPTDPDHTLCVSYVNADNSVVRYRLYSSDNEVIYLSIPEYNGELIKKNFRIEIWSTDAATVNLASDLTIYTSVMSSGDYRYITDSELIGDDGLCEGQAAGNVTSLETTPFTDDFPFGKNYWFKSTEGLGALTWTDRLQGDDLVAAAPANMPSYDSGDGSLTFAPASLISGSLVTQMSDLFLLIKQVSSDGAIFASSSIDPLTIEQDPLNTPNIIVTYRTATFTLTLATLDTWCILRVYVDGGSNIYVELYDALTGTLLESDSASMVSPAPVLDSPNTVGGGGEFNLLDLLAYSSTLSDEAASQTLSYLRGRIPTSIPLPLTWGTCAQPTLNV